MIAIIDYGLGNLESVKYALDRLSKPSELTSEAGKIASAAPLCFSQTFWRFSKAAGLPSVFTVTESQMIAP